MPSNLIFPSDMGRATYERKSTGSAADPYYFINFGIIKSSMSSATLPAGKSVSLPNGTTIPSSNAGQGIDFSSNNIIPASRASVYATNTVSQIFLYMPNEISVNYAMDITNTDMGMLKNYISEGAMSGLADSASYLSKTFGERVYSSLLSGADSAANIFALDLASKGRSFNPVTEQLFKNVKPRKFNYKFDLVARNANEGNVIQDIISAFKFHMHPEISAGSAAEFIYPSLFVIGYYRAGGGGDSGALSTQLNKISGCFLEDMKVNYTGSAGQFQSFADGQPLHIVLDLAFVETVIQTKKSIADGF